MFHIKDPCTLSRPWTLSRHDDKEPHVIPEDVTKYLRNYHILAIEFLYRKLRKGLKGAILNEEDGMNFPLQISAFFRSILKEKQTVLIICPQQSLCSWHYHLSNCGAFNVEKISVKNCSYSFGEDRLALLLESSDFKLLTNFEDTELFSVVIEDFDTLAKKMLIQKVKGEFNIGLTHRSFYTRPDSKLQWKMLNWANPGCVGKLHNFYKVDNENLRNFRDNYSFWWLRLTWKFCESFEKPTPEQRGEEERRLNDWSDQQNLGFSRKRKNTETKRLPIKKNKKEPETTQNVESDSKKKRKNTETTTGLPNAKNKKPETTQNAEHEEKNKISGPELDFDDGSSSDTIINEVPIDKYVKLPSMDENPILTSIIRNFELSPEPEISDVPCCSYSSFLTHSEENSVIFSFFNNNRDQPCSSKSESDNFIINFIENTEENKQNLSEDIEEFLKDTESLLQNSQ